MPLPATRGAFTTYFRMFWHDLRSLTSFPSISDHFSIHSSRNPLPDPAMEISFARSGYCNIFGFWTIFLHHQKLDFHACFRVFRDFKHDLETCRKPIFDKTLQLFGLIKKKRQKSSRDPIQLLQAARSEINGNCNFFEF